jgi:hypothetical protein
MIDMRGLLVGYVVVSRQPSDVAARPSPGVRRARVAVWVVVTSVPLVPTAADHFTAFLDRAADDARVRAGLAGESPARFRGRVLMERAAWLMTTTDRTLLDIALDSGFTGQAGFASAFRREFGVLPSVWRADPTSYVVEAPGEAHFHPPSGLRLPARHRSDGLDLVVAMVEHHVARVGELVERAGLVSDDHLDEVSDRTGPGAGDGTLRGALSRLVDQMEELNAAVRDDGHDDADGGGGIAVARESVVSMRRRLDRVGPELVHHVTRLAASGRFDETFVEAFSPTPQVRSYGAMVAHVLTSGAHDRVLALLATSR